jgi:type 1 glutamine amidotransferase
VVLENQRHPVVQGVPDIWDHEEEWYSWAKSPRAAGFTVLATIDEGSYTPVQKLFGRETDLRMDDHPVVWARCVGDGRSVYAAMGHRPQAFDNPPVRQIIENSLAWVMKLNDPQEYDGC